MTIQQALLAMALDAALLWALATVAAQVFVAAADGSRAKALRAAVAGAAAAAIFESFTLVSRDLLDAWVDFPWLLHSFGLGGPDLPEDGSPSLWAAVSGSLRPSLKLGLGTAVLAFALSWADLRRISFWMAAVAAAVAVSFLSRTSWLPIAAFGYVAAFAGILASHAWRFRREWRRPLAWAAALGGAGLATVYAAALAHGLAATPGPGWGLSRLIAGLESPDRQVRRRSARLIEKLGAQALDALEPLDRLMKRDEELACAAADAMAAIGEASVGTLAEAYRSPTWQRHGCATMGLRALGAKAKDAVPVVLESARSGPPSRRREALTLLPDIGAEAGPVVPLLLEALETNDDALARTAESVLPKYKEAAIPGLAAILKGPPGVYGERHDRAIRILYALGPAAKSGAPVLTPIFRAQLAGQSGVASLAAIQFLGSFGPEASAAIPDILAHVSDPQPNIRRGAIIALGKLGGRRKDVLEALRAGLKDTDLDVRLVAASVLAKLGQAQDEVAAAMTALLGHANPNIRLAAGKVLDGLKATAPAARAP
ncbi:MAG: HEAT repeat domain-containing protein [Elusimicrobia bacterium]|nr:HEAT repeat domain-containing protein [Elusimicrobiota bacterium]